MNKTDLVEQSYLRSDIPEFRPGDTVKVHVRVVEGSRERVQVFQGVVIRRQNGGLRETFTVRKISFGVGVERTFPVHSPSIAKLEVVSRGKVRRAKLYYLRELRGKKARIKERRLDDTKLAALEAAALAAPAAGRRGGRRARRSGRSRRCPTRARPSMGSPTGHPRRRKPPRSLRSASPTPMTPRPPTRRRRRPRPDAVGDRPGAPEPLASPSPHPSIVSGDIEPTQDRVASAPPDEEHEHPDEGSGDWGFFREFGFLTLAALLIAIVIKTFLIQAFFIPSGSMEPTLMPNDRILVNRLAYRFGDIERGDIIVFADPTPSEQHRGVLGSFIHWLGEGHRRGPSRRRRLHQTGDRASR